MPKVYEKSNLEFFFYSSDMDCQITSDRYGIRWSEIDEHLSVKAFLKGLS